VSSTKITGLFSRNLQDPQRDISVLVVDDVPTNRTAIKSLLSGQSYRVTEAMDGPSALDAIGKQPFDLVILDVIMPGMDGLQVLEKVRTKYTESELPVLILTIKDEIKDVVRGLELGANDYVTRPIDYSILVARINNLVTYKLKQDSMRKSQVDLQQQVSERSKDLMEANRALRAQVAERQFAEEKARASEARYRALYDDTPTMFFTLKPSGEIVSVNRFGATYLGYRVNELTGKPITAVYPEPDHDAITEHIDVCLRAPDIVHRWESRKVHRNGTVIWVRVCARVVDDDDEQRILLVCEDITNAKELTERINHLSKHDAVTGLLNRHEFELNLDYVLEHSRKDQTQHSLCYIDVEPVSIIRETYGHVAGDELLSQIGNILREMTRPSDTLARVDGDRFAVILKFCDLGAARDSARRFRKALSKFQFQWDDHTFSLTPSIGVAPIREGVGGITGILSAADAACYAARGQSANGIYIYDRNDDELLRRRDEIALIGQIRSALDEDRFHLYLQEIAPVTGGSNAQRHCEILLRMEDDNGQLLAPAIFFPAVERYKYSSEIDHWVIAHALAWISGDPSRLDRWQIFYINIASHAASGDDLASFIKGQIELTGIPPEKLCFELSETNAIANLSQTQRFIRDLKAVGCRFALDDFGSGLSSFAYLKELPVDFIKIDGAFVRDMDNNPSDRAIVQAINEIVHALDKKTIAEFASHRLIIQHLTEIGVDFAQGFAVGEPRPVEHYF